VVFAQAKWDIMKEHRHRQNPSVKDTMAHTKAQIEAKQWIREEYLQKKYRQPFREQSLELQSRALAKFDAVSEDGEIVAAISMRVGFSAGGRKNQDDLNKTRSDALRFLMLDYIPKERLMIFTEQSMIDLVKDEKKGDRFPKALKIVKVKMPPDIAARVEEARGIVSEEDAPEKE
jgi:hypothetical protein